MSVSDSGNLSSPDASNNNIPTFIEKNGPNSGEKYADNTQSTLRTEETTKPSETEQSKDEEGNGLFGDKNDEFEKRIQNEMDDSSPQHNDLLLSEKKTQSKQFQCTPDKKESTG